MIFSNKTKEDIIYKEQLDKLQAANHPYFTVIYTLTRHKEGDGEWDGELGRIDSEMVKKHMPPHADDVFIAVCGNKEFNDNANGILEELGYVSGVSRA